VDPGNISGVATGTADRASGNAVVCTGCEAEEPGETVDLGVEIGRTDDGRFRFFQILFTTDFDSDSVTSRRRS
jgi:hypothetical protein